MRKLLAFLFIISFLYSCKKEATIKDSISQNPAIEIGEIKNHRVSLEQANKIAILESIYTEGVRKSSKKSISVKNPFINAVGQKEKPAKSIKSTFSYKKDEGDVTFYIINYKEGGFVIVSGDNRTLPIMAQSDEGNFPIEKNKKLPDAVNEILMVYDRYVNSIRSKNEKQSTIAEAFWKEIQIKSELSTGNQNTIKTFPECVEEGAQLLVMNVYQAPLVTTQWGQSTGYNNAIPFLIDVNNNFEPIHCPDQSNGRPAAGCVAVATGQVMNYFQYPTSYNWSLIGLPGAGTSELIYDIGESSISTLYGCVNSAAWPSNVPTALTSDFGYSNANFGNYDDEITKNNILNSKPVIVSGHPSWEIWNWHAWIASGVKQWTIWECRLDWGPVEGKGVPGDPGGFWFERSGATQFYMNWGWDGAFDGWFGVGNFTLDGDTYVSRMNMTYNITP